MRAHVPPVRSMLFVPGNRVSWVDKAAAAGADAVILDLEDAVPSAEKVDARDAVSVFMQDGRTDNITVLVRVNSLSTSDVLDDLDAVVSQGLTAVMIPKVVSPHDVVVADRLLGWWEQKRGLVPGTVAIMPVLETAAGIKAALSIARASDRVAYLGGLGVKGGDIERAIGYRWSPGGRETFVLRSTVLLDARAAGIPNPISGMWADVTDLEGLRRFAEQTRDLGYEGLLAIHPSHVSIINDIFTPSPEELERDRQLVAAVEAASVSGAGATVFDGQMVDEAMAVTARARLARYVQASRA